ncbi:hypothetical protein R3P38DRAFT_3219477 [Favolaschia claudopus]|uniref:F-box domain-containing protein n=1 Tax=Favolaschia claudopus TaxID=2862362 RepID=A0AAW0A254_9AGAR
MFPLLTSRIGQLTGTSPLHKPLYAVPRCVAQIDEFSQDLEGRKSYTAKFTGFLFATDVHLGVEVPVMVKVGVDLRVVTIWNLFVHAWIAYAGLAHVVDMESCSHTVVDRPGTVLEQAYTIFYTPQNVAEPKNTGGVTDSGKIPFRGNILVIKHSGDNEMPMDITKDSEEHYRITMLVRHKHRPASQAFHDLLNTFDVMVVILEYVDFRDLWTLTQTTKAFQSMCRRFFRTRADVQISTFLSAKSPVSKEFDKLLYDFWQLITTSHSAVYGSLLLYIERCVQSNKPWLPHNLNIAVPRGAVIPWIVYLRGLCEDRPLKFKQIEVDCFVRGHIASIWQVEIITGRAIILTETRGRCIAEAVIISPHTANMQFLTRDFLVIYYAQKAFDASAIDSWHYPTIQASQHLERRGIRKSIDNSSWLSQCRWTCPILWRQVSCDRGTLNFRIGDDTAVLDSTITSSKLQWRLGDTCYNSECKNYAAHYYPYIPVSTRAVIVMDRANFQGYYSELGAELRST